MELISGGLYPAKLFEKIIPACFSQASRLGGAQVIRADPGARYSIQAASFGAGVPACGSIIVDKLFRRAGVA